MLIGKIDVLFSYSNGEQGQFSHWVQAAGPTDSSQAEIEAAADAFYGQLSGDVTFMSDFPSTITFNGWRASLIQSTTGAVVSVGEGGAPSPGLALATGSMPNQLAVTVTLRTSLAGARHRGRFYLPCPVFDTVTTAGRLDTATAADMVTSINNAFATEIALAPVMQPIVYSRVGHAATVVTRLEIGDVFDTQRRRRDKLVEVRTGALV